MRNIFKHQQQLEPKTKKDPSMRLLSILMLIFFTTGTIAQELPEPEGAVILTVSGNITVTNGDGTARFDRPMLEALEQRTTTTSTPWFDGIHDFSGPLGQAILDRVGANGKTIRVTALNDYGSLVPTQDFRDFELVFATHVDQRELSVREKGPLFLIYPFDERPELFDEVYFSRSAWQIDRIEVID